MSPTRTVPEFTHLERGEHAVARVLGVLHRRAPERHDRVADVTMRSSTPRGIVMRSRMS
jgi:hypothetical protein